MIIWSITRRRPLGFISSGFTLPWSEVEKELDGWSQLRMRHEIYRGGLRCREETDLAILEKLW